LEQLEVGSGDHLGDARLLKVFDNFGSLVDVEVQKLVEELLAVVAFKDEVLGHALDV